MAVPNRKLGFFLYPIFPQSSRRAGYGLHSVLFGPVLQKYLGTFSVTGSVLAVVRQEAKQEGGAAKPLQATCASSCFLGMKKKSHCVIPRLGLSSERRGMTNPLTASQTWLKHVVAGFFSKHPPLLISFVFSLRYLEFTRPTGFS